MNLPEDASGSMPFSPHFTSYLEMFFSGSLEGINSSLKRKYFTIYNVATYKHFEKCDAREASFCILHSLETCLR
jgi:hypothetical protein